MQQIFSSDPLEPLISEEVIKFLQSKFPLEGFRNVRSFEQLQRYQGALDVIDLLKATHARQNREGDTNVFR